MPEVESSDISQNPESKVRGEFKIPPQSTPTTRTQRQPQNHRAHLKIRHLFPGGVSIPPAQEKRVLGQL